jgi:hypothetical protein
MSSPVMSSAVHSRDAGPDYEIIACADNTPYLLWQSLLFYDSCLETQGVAPTFVVHAQGPQLAGFAELPRLGARIVPAPSYRASRGREYVARNTAGTLLEATPQRPWALVCDPDFLFLAPLPGSAERIHRGRPLSWDHAPYLQVSGQNRRWLSSACAQLGIDVLQLERMGAGGVVPYLVHRERCRTFAARWLEAVDALVGSGLEGGEVPWLSLPWGFALAAWQLRLEIELTRLTQTTYEGHQLPASALRAPILHYCYGDALFDKRRHGTAEGARGVWSLTAAGGSVSAQLVQRLQQARARLALRGLDVTDLRLYQPAHAAL